MNNISKEVPVCTITSIGSWSDNQWYIFGLMELAHKGDILLQFKADRIYQLAQSALLNQIPYMHSVLLRLHYRQLNKKQDIFRMLEGYVEYQGKKKSFCIDGADAPFIFSDKKLSEVDRYFKTQCPQEFHKEGFTLAPGVVIPWSSEEFEEATEKEPELRNMRKQSTQLMNCLQKVSPLMTGPRCLCPRSQSYQSMKVAYEHYLSSSQIPQTKKVMSYFGNSLGPKPFGDKRYPNVNSESNLMMSYAAFLSHPNEKRALATDILSNLGEGYDGRLISRSNADSAEGVAMRNKSLIVPLGQFCHHIAQFAYNLNISGYRMSIPNRFIESFMAGTAILTDRLAVKWYKPFGCEVKETVEMGYLPMNKVDWEQYRKDILQLPRVRKEDVLKAFYEKWAPEVVARYIVEETLRE